jgi:tryptophan synthase beta chain
MDLGGYDAYFSGKLTDYPLPQDEMNKSLKSIEGLPKPAMLRKGKPIK